MKKLLLASLFASGAVIGVEAAPTDVVTQADLKALIDRIARLEALNQAQAKRIAELESGEKRLDVKVAEQTKRLESLPQGFNRIAGKSAEKVEDGTTKSESGRVYTTGQGYKYYLADKAAGIFEPLSESGFKLTPYGYLVLEGVWASRDLAADWSTDFVNPNCQKRNQTTLSMQDSILGLQFETPESYKGWTFTGRAEFDFAGSTQNDYAFHWRHLYVNAEHESGWSFLFGQTWHLWKIVSPSEIDGAWMENAGHPYRRSPQIRVTRKWDFEDSLLEARFGIVKGGPGMGGDRDSDNIEDNSASAWVLLEGALVYQHDAVWQDKKDPTKRWMIGLGGMYGQDKSHRLMGPGVYGGDEDSYDSMMGLIALQVPFGPFTLTGQFYGGQNLGGVQAGCGQTVAYHTFDSPGNEVRTIGGFVDLGYRLNDDWSFALGWGCDDPVNSDIEGSLDGRNAILYNDRAYVCAFYQVMSNFKIGLEYARLLTSYDEGDGAEHDYDADRVQFSAFFDF